MGCRSQKRIGCLVRRSGWFGFGFGGGGPFGGFA